MAGKKGMNRHSLEFRQKIVDLHLNEGYSKKQLCEEYGISDIKQVKNWCRWYKQFGVPQQVTGKELGRSKKSEETDKEKIARLEMENALLKKFHELLEEEHKRK